MNKTPSQPFQFRLIDLLAVMLWVAIVLAAWRSGLLQPRLMPLLFPPVAGIGVYVALRAAKRFNKRTPGG
jgi:hypothetical protein